jgi:Leucine-rich repeat (LRR) protein
LPSDIKILDISNRKLKSIPDLSRFIDLEELRCNRNYIRDIPPLNKKLKTLDCSYNNIYTISELVLPENLEKLYCSNNFIQKLPELNSKLTSLDCSNNWLTSLPLLNENLTYLSCSNNQLTNLPTLNENLSIITCRDNRLKKLPLLNKKLSMFNYRNNFISNVIYGDLDIIKNKSELLYDLTHRHFALKYKNIFRNWLWERVRKPKIEKLYSPEMLNLILDNLENSDDEDELDNKINNW